MQDNILKKNWCDFIKVCLKVKNTQQLFELFELFLTKAEQDDIAIRYAIVKGLLSGNLTQRELAKKLKISIAKVTRGSNALRIADSKIKKIFG